MLGGKAGWTPASGERLKAGQACQMEAFPPFADDLARSIEARSNHVVGEIFRGEKDNLGPNNITIR